jgi:hypothetical protein
MNVVQENTAVIDRAFGESVVRDAETWFNARAIDPIVAGYDEEATLELVADGTTRTFAGRREIGKAWRLVFGIFPRMQLTKQIIAIDPRGTIVNEWRGSVDGVSRAYGGDLWWFDSSRRISRHVVFSFGRIVDSTSIAGRLRWLTVHPATALRALRVERDLGIGDPSR